MSEANKALSRRVSEEIFAQGNLDAVDEVYALNTGFAAGGFGTILGFDACADLSLAKTDSHDPVVAGEALTYTLIVTNDGPCDATEVVLTDTLPIGVTFSSASPGCGTAPARSRAVWANCPAAPTGRSRLGRR
jgi:uncharacterized repeat protein (TIGR01451 family)